MATKKDLKKIVSNYILENYKKEIDLKAGIEPGFIAGVTDKPLPPALTRLWRVMDPVKYGRDDRALFQAPWGDSAMVPDTSEQRWRRQQESRVHKRALRHDYNLGTPRDRPRTYMPIKVHVPSLAASTFPASMQRRPGGMPLMGQTPGSRGVLPPAPAAPLYGGGPGRR